MRFAMTRQRARSRHAVKRNRRRLIQTLNHRHIEVDQVRVVDDGAAIVDAVRVMADRARRCVGHNMGVMTGERAIGEDARAIVAVVAKRVSGGAFGRVIRRVVSRNQQRGKTGAMRPIRPGAAGGFARVRGVTVGTINDRRGGVSRA